MAMEEERVNELEMRLSYADDALRVLSDTVARQQQQIDQLQRLCAQIVERLRTQETEGRPTAPADEVPPHY